MKLIRHTSRLLIIAFLIGLQAMPDISAQQVPSKDENIAYLVTFGKEGKTSWGDDDFFDVWFFLIPKDFKQQFYIRILDPDCGGEIDEIQGEFNTKTMFSVYGGKGVDPDKNIESQGLEKGRNYKGGTLLSSRVFGKEAKYDNKYFTMGPFNPTAGDYSSKWDKYIFKIVCEGISGDDGNLYKYFLSRDAEQNIPIDGANAMTYKYTFRMWNDFKSVAHIYPYVDTGVVYVRQENFDWDDDGHIIVASRYRQGVEAKHSFEDDKANSRITIEQPEIGSSLDFQFIKKQGELVKNNNVVITIQNQRGENMPFYSSPIGGVPVYNPSIKVTKVKPR